MVTRYAALGYQKESLGNLLVTWHAALGYQITMKINKKRDINIYLLLAFADNLVIQGDMPRYQEITKTFFLVTQGGIPRYQVVSTRHKASARVQTLEQSFHELV